MTEFCVKSRLLGKKWMFLNLPRHESNTLLTAVLTAKDLFAQPIGAVVWVDYLKDISCLVCYYIFYFQHTTIYHIPAKSQGLGASFFLFFYPISKTDTKQRNPNDRPATRINTGLAGGGPRRQPLARSMSGLEPDGLKRYA